jgi:hypothetical protein
MEGKLSLEHVSLPRDSPLQFLEGDGLPVPLHAAPSHKVPLLLLLGKSSFKKIPVHFAVGLRHYTPWHDLLCAQRLECVSAEMQTG